MATPIKKAYKFAALKAEASKGRPKKPPFVIDDVVPKITIKAPRSLDQAIRYNELFGLDGELPVKNLRAAFEVICGENFAQVWALVKNEDVDVAIGLLSAIRDHYADEYDTSAADAPGGSDAS